MTRLTPPKPLNKMEAETQNLLQGAANEIRSLRKQNEHLQTRLQIYDDMISVFKGGERGGSMCMGEDIAWAIDQHLKSQTKTQ